MKLEPMNPATALELYLADRESEVTKATLYSHRSRLGHFVRWCDAQNITNLNELTGRRLHAYRLWRRSDGELKPASEKTQMDTLRVFIKWLESVDGVRPDLHTQVRSPTLTGDDNVRDIMLDSDQATRVLSYLQKYEYASRPHICLSLLWHTMMRVGAVHALDVSDYNSEEQYLEVIHRPESDTPIKNGERGERHVALSSEVCSLLDDWVDNRRPATTDDYEREPLLSSAQGRAHTSTLRADCYRYTRPCIVTGDCPHNRNIEDCPDTEYDTAYGCPSSVSPHALRRGGITHALKQDWPTIAVSDRANVSESVLDQHYDRRTQHRKMEQRRKYLENL